MAAAETPGDPRISANAAASSSLHETAKWLVGGVSVTAAGVFAGGSLTRLGSLDFAEQAARLWIAIGGALFGFLGLGFILSRAITALTVESVDFPMICNERRGTLARVRRTIEGRYGGALPGEAKDLPALLNLVYAAEHKRDRASRAFMRKFEALLPGLMAEAGFLTVRAKFAGLIQSLRIGAPLAVVGFGLFAWAANPPETKPAPSRPPFMTINWP